MDAGPVAKSPRKRQAVLALLVVTLIWGFTFVWMKQQLAIAEQQLGPEHLALAIALSIGLRFGIAALCMIVFVPAARRGLDGAAWRGGLLLGLLLLVGFVFQMFGLGEISPGVSAFLTSLYVLFTALLTAAWQRRALHPALAIGVLLATLGAGFIRGRPEFAFNSGELLTVACALMFALHILATDRVTKRVPAMPVTFTSFAVVTAGTLCAIVPMLASEDAPSAAALRELLTTREFVQPLVLTSLLATVVAISLMNVFQRELEPVRAAVLYAFEPVWAAILGWLYGMETVTPYLWVGGAALLAGNLVAEVGEQRKKAAPALEESPRA